eukprot:1159204-Karenia_brevis.AAC.1
MDIEAVSRRSVVDIVCSEECKDGLMRTALEFNFRLLHVRGVPYFQSLETTGFTQGRAREVKDKSKW